MVFLVWLSLSKRREWSFSNLLLVAWSGAARYSNKTSSPSLSSRLGYLNEGKNVETFLSPWVGAGEFGAKVPNESELLTVSSPHEKSKLKNIKWFDSVTKLQCYVGGELKHENLNLSTESLRGKLASVNKFVSAVSSTSKKMTNARNSGIWIPLRRPTYLVSTQLIKLNLRTFLRKTSTTQIFFILWLQSDNELPMSEM